MHIRIITLGSREFLYIQGSVSIPIDRIKHIDLNAPNGGADNSVRIITDDDKDDLIFAFENADAIRTFLISNTKVSTNVN